ncbi:class I SAM-dependent methyltransferase [Actinomadura sp. KC345]|uniref:class I SAM-dependent methyltransferase n=1 Tax=Actinomadura sp. KC345 TaxID=2530371 RepID=UPI00104C07CB|nr:class I SAM-dependent methyltransferase [Actinomadura sp. KC345]TDC54728.1 class I SAM-dependent methyltransferase [Actinomadura sp. KC345]
MVDTQTELTDPTDQDPTDLTDLTRRLVHAGTASDDQIQALVDAAGLDAVARALGEEICFRCPEPVNPMPIDVALDVGHRDQERRLVLHVVRDRPVRLREDRPGTIWSQVGIGVTDLVRRLYGRGDRRMTGDFRNTFLPSPDDPESLYSMFSELSTLLSSAAQATGTVMAGCAPRCPDLGELSLRYGSDKWASFHWYTPHYERHFASLRDEPVRILEIGIGGYEDDPGGSSLKMWKRFFHRGEIFGLDLYDKSELNETRLTALTGDQNAPEELIAIAEEHGPFDVVIDDGSHMNEHVHTSFRTLFSYVRAGGLYVIEDLQTAYFPGFGGSSGDTAEPHTSIGLVKRLLDDLHHREYEQRSDTEPSLTQRTVVGVHMYHNIVFVEKGVNGEDGLPAWMDASAWDALGAK